MYVPRVPKTVFAATLHDKIGEVLLQEYKKWYLVLGLVVGPRALWIQVHSQQRHRRRWPNDDDNNIMLKQQATIQQKSEGV